MVKPVFTKPQVIHQLAPLADGGRLPASPITVGLTTEFRYNTSSDGTTYSPGARNTALRPLNSAQQIAARQSIRLWADLIATPLAEVAPRPYYAPLNGLTGYIEIMNADIPDYAAGWAFGAVYDSNGKPWNATIQINDSYSYEANPSPTDGAYGQMTFTHELGHALGRPHPGAYNASGGDPITYENSAEYFQDSYQYTIMSYFRETNTGANYLGYYPQTPMLDDILAIQAMYGADRLTRITNTTYGFHNTADNVVYNYSINLHPIQSIYDAGGIDKIDLSGYSTNATLDLGPGRFSSFNGMTYNLSIAYNTTIENGTGGGGDDTIYGNTAANVLEGLGGNDTLSGGAGNDRLIGGEGNDVLIGGAGNDILIGGPGNDVLRGGAGVNTANYNDIANGVTVDLRKTGPQNTGAGTDTLSFIQNIVGSKHDDRLVGDDANNVLTGAGGDDVLVGNGGKDKLIGGAGTNTLYGGEGADTFVLDSLEGLSRIQDYNPQDFFDVSRLTGKFNLNAANITDYVSFRNAGTSVSMSLDMDGKGAGAPVRIASIAHTSDLNPATLFDNHHLIA